MQSRKAKIQSIPWGQLRCHAKNSEGSDVLVSVRTKPNVMDNKEDFNNQIFLKDISTGSF